MTSKSHGHEEARKFTKNSWRERPADFWSALLQLDFFVPIFGRFCNWAMRQLVVVKRVAKSGCGKTGRLLGISGGLVFQYSIQKCSAGRQAYSGRLGGQRKGRNQRVPLHGEQAQYADVGRAEDSKLRGQILQPVLAARGFATGGQEIAGGGHCCPRYLVL